MFREGNLKVEDVIAVLHRRTETDQAMKYYVVDSVEALSKFGQGGGGDPWYAIRTLLSASNIW